MIQRCCQPKQNCYTEYGGHGIKVCDRWKSFENFLTDMGERPAGMTLDRFPDGKGNYELGNCRWATPLQQTVNTSRTIKLTAFGETRTVREWSSIVGIKGLTIRYRLRKGIKPEVALSHPLWKHGALVEAVR